MRFPRPAAVLAAAIVAVVASVAVANMQSHRKQPPTAAGSVAVTRPLQAAVLVCPAAGAIAGVTSSIITAGAPPGGSGTLTLSRFGPAPGPPVVIAGPTASRIAYSVPPAKAGAFVVRATGARARGLSAAVITRTAAGLSRGMSTVPCTAPAGQSWLVGGSAAIGRLSRVYLSNADPTPAVVNLTVYTTKGAQQPPSAQGLQVPPLGQMSVAVDSLLPGQGMVAVQVSASSGRVSAAMFDAQRAGLVPQGVDWVPPSAPPADQVVLAGIPGPPTATLPGDPHLSRTLSLLVPGAVNATVSVRLVTGAGTLSPPALAAFSVPSQAVHQIDLDAYAADAPYSVVVQSDQPVVAGVRTVEGAAGTVQDFSYTAGSMSAQQSLVLPYASSDPSWGTALQLVNPGQHDITVTVAFTPPVSREGTLRVLVPAGRLVQVRVGTSAGPPTSLLITSTPGGSLRVGWIVSEEGAHGPLITGGPVLQTPLVQSLPAVRSDPAAGYPGH